MTSIFHPKQHRQFMEGNMISEKGKLGRLEPNLLVMWFELRLSISYDMSSIKITFVNVKSYMFL